MKRLLVGLVCTFMLAGPAAARSGPDVGGYPGADAGVIVASVATVGIAAISFEAERIDQPGYVRDGVSPLSLHRDVHGRFDDPNFEQYLRAQGLRDKFVRLQTEYSGQLKAIAVPPGHYRLTKVVINNSGGIGHVVIDRSFDAAPNVDFDVPSGGTVYLGRLVAIPIYGTTRWRAALIDAREEDLQTALKKGAEPTFDLLASLVEKSAARPFLN